MLKKKVAKAVKTVKSDKTSNSGKVAVKPAKALAAAANKTSKPSAKIAKSAKLAAPVATKAISPAAVAVKVSPRTEQFNKKDLQSFRKELIVQRDRLTGQVAKMREDSLKRDDEVNTEEDGTDAFDRLFALERAGSEQDVIFMIDESIRAIDTGVYGVCECCEKLIEKPRLQALPFAKNCIRCQSEMERGRNNGGIRRQVP